MRVAISVEGQTEEEFVKRVLAPYFNERGIVLTPIVLGAGRRGPRGGNVSTPRLAGEMAALFHNFDAVSSLVDYYGYRGKGKKSIDELEQQLTAKIRDNLGTNWRQDRVLAYVQRFEFEGLLFSNVEAFSVVIDASEEDVNVLQTIRDSFMTPEDINDNRETTPANRIKTVLPRYHKVRDGSLVAENTGIGAMLAQCPRFSEWVKKLETIGRKS